MGESKGSAKDQKNIVSDAEKKLNKPEPVKAPKQGGTEPTPTTDERLHENPAPTGDAETVVAPANVETDENGNIVSGNLKDFTPTLAEQSETLGSEQDQVNKAADERAKETLTSIETRTDGEALLAAEVEQADKYASRYGKDYVLARKGANEQPFTRRAWDMLSKKDKDGWSEVIAEPAEVKALKKK